MGRRPKNPRVLAIAYARNINASMRTVVYWLTEGASRTVWVPLAERPEGAHHTRPRQPHEHIDNDPQQILSALQWTERVRGDAWRLECLLRFKLAQLGCDQNGNPMNGGVPEAMACLSREAIEWARAELNMPADEISRSA